MPGKKTPSRLLSELSKWVFAALSRGSRLKTLGGGGGGRPRQGSSSRPSRSSERAERHGQPGGRPPRGCVASVTGAVSLRTCKCEKTLCLTNVTNERIEFPVVRCRGERKKGKYRDTATGSVFGHKTLAERADPPALGGRARGFSRWLASYRHDKKVVTSS